MSLELEVWREACRHIEIEESVDRLAPLLSRHLPLDRVLVWRFDPKLPRRETVAVGVCAAGASSARARADLDPDSLARLLAWGQRREVRAGEPGERDPLLALVAPRDVAGATLSGPLLGEEGFLGVLTLVAARGHA